MKRRDAGTEKNRMVAGWSTKMLEEVANLQDFEDAEDMVQWRSICQEGINDLRKELCGKMEEEALEKFFNQKGREGRVQGRGEPLEWRIVSGIRVCSGRTEENQQPKDGWQLWQDW